MTRPELRLITGENTPQRMFMDFVMEHSEPTPDVIHESDQYWIGEYRLSDDTQLIPVDSVQFEVEKRLNEQSYSVIFKNTITNEAFYEVRYDDTPPRVFFDRNSELLHPKEAERVIGLLSVAEASGQLKRVD